MLDFAMQLMQQGIYAVPYAYDTKNPRVPYSHWRDCWPFNVPATDDYYLLWQKYGHNSGMLMLCNDLCVIDIDVKNALPEQNLIKEFEEFLILNHPDLYEKLYVEFSPSGGKHYIYRPWTSQKSFTLARRNSTAAEIVAGKPKFHTLVDFLGDEKLCRVAPSKGYECEQGSLLDLATLTEDEHNIIILAAMQLNSYVEEEISYPKSTAKVNGFDHDKRPGDVYNDRVEVSDIVSMCERHGYKVIGRQGCMIKLNRPLARSSGVDATINADQRWFYPFSSSLPFPPEKAMSFFSLYANLEHNGDFSAAGKAIVEMYGLRQESKINGRLPNFDPYHAPVSEKKTQSEKDEFDFSAEPLGDVYPDGPADEVIENPDSLWRKLAKNRFSFNNEIKEQWMLYWKDPYAPYPREIPVGGQGMLIAITGKSKSFKSQLVGAIESTALGKEHQTGFRIYMPDDRPEILHYDTEQSGIWAHWSVKCINYQADIGCDMPNYHAYFLREYSAAERRAIIRGMVMENPRIGLLVIDGILDLVNNYNDEKEAAEVLQFLMTLSDMGIMVITVIHTGESVGGTSKPLGHLGSAVMRKSDAIFNCTIENEEDSADNVKIRRVKVRQTTARGEPISSFSMMSYQKMVYLMGRDVPEHYRKWYAKETGIDLPAFEDKITPEMKAMQAVVGAAKITVERVEPEEFIMPPTGRAAAIAPEKDDDDDFLALIGLTPEELRNTS